MRKSAAGWFCIILFAGGVTVILLEGCSRLYYLFQNSSAVLQLSNNPQVIFEPKPNQRVMNQFHQEVRTNALGLKGPEVEPRSPHEYRILVIGDSIMAGEYLPESQRLPNFLARRIRLETGYHTMTWSGAVGGYNVWQEFGALQKRIRQVEPDLVLIGVCANDFVRIRSRAFQWRGHLFIISQRDGSIARYFNALYQISDFYKLLYDSIHQVRLRCLSSEKFLVHYPVPGVTPADEEAWANVLEEMAHLAKDHGAVPLFVFFPLHPQVYRGEAVMNAHLFQWASKKDYPFVDLTQTFQNEDATGMSLFRDRDIIHPTEKGFQIASKAVFDYLKRQHIVSPL